MLNRVMHEGAGRQTCAVSAGAAKIRRTFLKFSFYKKVEARF